MFKKIFHQQINSITVAAALVALSSLASRLLGVFRDRILAGEFGAGASLDIYYAAFRIPDLIFNLIILGALSAGFVPIFTSLIKDFSCEIKNDCEPQRVNQTAWALANNVLNFLLVGLGIVSLLGIIFAYPLTKIITPGFSPADQALTASLTRIMFLSPLFLGISGILGGALQSFKRFFIYSLSPIFYNIGIILGALYFVDSFGLIGLAWGVVLGSFLHMIIQLPTVYQLGFRYQFKIFWHDVNTWKIWRMMVPRTLSLAISQINLVVITVIASSLTSGSLTVFNLANNLQSFPIGIFGVSFAIAAFPSLSIAAFDKKKLSASFSQTMRQILFFIVPATVFVIILRAQIIRVILGSGNFTWSDTILTMNTLGYFALSLFSQATIPLLIRVFYARHNSATPLYFGIITVGVNIVLSLILAPRMGVAGLALAFSLANILNFLLLWLAIYFSIGNLDIGNILKSVLKFTVSAIAAGSIAQVMKVVIWPFIDMAKFSGVFIQLLVSGLTGMVVYLLLCYLLKSEELFGFTESLKNRWPFKKVKIDDQGEARGV